jgi:prephenate dehydratase
VSASAPISILIQGELGSFSHEAAQSILPDAQIIPCATALDLFTKMYTYRNTLALIPIENSLAGSVAEFYELLYDRAEEYKIKILREHQHRIRHNLIAKPGTDLSPIGGYVAVYSHPIALAQCRNFFAGNPFMQPVAYYDTAGSVKMILEQDNPRWAAIASEQAAKLYGGQISIKGIEDDPQNYTRFFLLQFEIFPAPPPPMIPPDGPPDKMSLFFSLKNRPGALVEALGIFSKLEMNLTKIESRPIQGRPWEYMFYVDVLFPKSEAADEAMARLRPICETMIDLGRYKAAVLG